MDGRKAGMIISVLITSPLFLYIAGIAAQFAINIKAWEAAGGNYNVSPGLPSLELQAVIKALFTVPEGPISIAAAAGFLLFLILYGRYGNKKDRGIVDPARNLKISRSGSYGTAGFMTEREAQKNLCLIRPERTELDILGAIDKKRVITLGADTRLNQNLAVCGASGSGKSRSISRNLVLQAARRGDSIIVTDPKSELYESMAPYLRDRGYTVRVLNLVNMDASDSWNCLNEVQGDEAMAQTFADIVLSNTGAKHNDDFWHYAELNLLKALVLYVSLEEEPENRNFGRIYDLLCNCKEEELSAKFEAVSKVRVDARTGQERPPSPAYPPYALFRQSSEGVRSSIIIGLGSKLQVMQPQKVRNITSYDEIDLELPGKQKCAYFCIVSDQDNTFNFISSLMFSFLFIRLIHYADGYCENGMLPVKVKFIMDEFTNCLTIPDFTKKVSVIRSRGCSVAIFLQNIGQLKNRYPDDQWEEILGACDTTVFLGCNDTMTADYYSGRTGVASVELEIEARDFAAGRFDSNAPNYRRTNSLGRRQLMTPDEVMRLPPDEELIFVRGMKTLRAQRFDYSRHPDYRMLHSEKAILHEPAWKKLSQIRDKPEPDPKTVPGPVADTVQQKERLADLNPDLCAGQKTSKPVPQKQVQSAIPIDLDSI